MKRRSGKREVLLSFLEQVLKERLPAMADKLERGGPKSFSKEEAVAVIAALGDEIGATGVDENGEMNERGRLLDDAISMVLVGGTR